jgi:hypothetical protein
MTISYLNVAAEAGMLCLHGFGPLRRALTFADMLATESTLGVKKGSLSVIFTNCQAITCRDLTFHCSQFDRLRGANRASLR